MTMAATTIATVSPVEPVNRRPVAALSRMYAAQHAGRDECENDADRGDVPAAAGEQHHPAGGEHHPAKINEAARRGDGDAERSEELDGHGDAERYASKRLVDREVHGGERQAEHGGHTE